VPSQRVDVSRASRIIPAAPAVQLQTAKDREGIAPSLLLSFHIPEAEVNMNLSEKVYE
jgi:hypothetical protein